MKVLPSVERFFRDQAPRVGAPHSEWYRDIRKAIQDPAAVKAIDDGDASMSALLRNTISITVVRAGYKTNVIPGTAEAELDVRLLPVKTAGVLDRLRAVIDGRPSRSSAAEVLPQRGRPTASCSGSKVTRPALPVPAAGNRTGPREPPFAPWASSCSFTPCSSPWRRIVATRRRRAASRKPLLQESACARSS
jgi:hypothetical protein